MDDRKTMQAALETEVFVGVKTRRLHPRGAGIAGELVGRAETLLVDHANQEAAVYYASSVTELPAATVAEGRAARRAAAGLLRAAAAILDEL